MYKLTYYPSLGTSQATNKQFETLDEAWKFLFDKPAGTLIELKYYEDSDNNRPTLWSS